MPNDALPPELAGFAFTTSDAREHGLDRGRLRGADLVHPHHGVYVAKADATEDDVMARCERLIPALGPLHWFSHRTAARIWGVPLKPAYSPGEGLHVTTVGSRVPLRHAGTVGWATGEALRVEMFDLLPVVSPADVWCQLAARGAVVAGEIIAHEWLVAAGDYLTTGRRRGGGIRDIPLCTLEDVRAAVERRTHGRGTAVLRRALADIRSPVDSPYETRLRLGLVQWGLPEPQVQVPVQTAVGLRHADLGYPDARLLLEYQGDEHRVSRKRWLEDLTRIQLFQDAGYDVILVGAADLEPDCSALATRVRRALHGENRR